MKCGIIYSEGYYWSAQGHMRDHPDENQSPGKMEYPTPWLTRTEPSHSTSPTAAGDSVPPVGLPDIGILLSGWADGYGHILGKYGIETLPEKLVSLGPFAGLQGQIVLNEFGDVSRTVFINDIRNGKFNNLAQIN